MTGILDAISCNYINKMNLAHASGNFDAIEQYVDEKKSWENAIRTALTQTLTTQEQDYIEFLQLFFELEHKVLTE